jgi:hypothetical protein
MNTVDDFGITHGATASIPFYISTTDNVGIGSTNPGAKLDVNGQVTGASGTKSFVSLKADVNQSATAGYTGINLNVTETALGSGPNNLLKLSVGGVSKFSVNNSGMVTVAGLNLAAGSGAGKILQSDATGNASWVNPPAAGVTSISSANTDIGITGTTTPVLTLNSGTTGGAGDAGKILKLDASGLIATGMLPSIPTSNLPIVPVSKGGTGQSTLTSGNLLVGNGTTAVTMLSPGAAGGFVRSNGTSWVRSAIGAGDLGAGTPDGTKFLRDDLTWQTLSAVSSSDPRLNPSPTGNALSYIRVNSGATAYEARTPAQARGDISAAISGANGDITSMTAVTSVGSSGALALNAGGTNQNVSITPSGTGKFVVNGPIQITGGTPGAGKVLQSDASGNATWVTPAAGATAAGGNNQIQFNSSGAFGANTNFVWDSTNSRLGVGTSAPSAKVSIYGSNISEDALVIDTVGGFTSNLVNLKNSGVQKFLIDGQGNVFSNGKFESSGFNSSAYTSSSGGSSAPVAGGLLVTGNTSSTDSTATAINLKVKNGMGNNQSAYVAAVSNGGAGTYAPTLVFGSQTGSNSYQENMRIDQTGKVGIGTFAPAYKLHVYSPQATNDLNPVLHVEKSIDGQAESNVEEVAAVGSQVHFTNNHNGTYSATNSGFADYSGAFSAVSSVLVPSGKSDNNGGQIGINAAAVRDGTSNVMDGGFIKSLLGARVLVGHLNSSSAPSTQEAIGVMFDSKINSGTITSVTALNADFPQLSGSGSVGTYTGIKIGTKDPAAAFGNFNGVDVYVPQAFGAATRNGFRQFGTNGLNLIEGKLQFGNTSTAKVNLSGPNAAGGTYTVRLPATAPTNGQYLQVSNWDSPSQTADTTWAAAGGGGGPVTTAGSDTIIGAGVGTIQFQSGTSPATTMMTMSNSGNLGIGSTNPVAKLDVNGNANINGGITLANNTPSSCSAANIGMMRRNVYDIEICDGASWIPKTLAGKTTSSATSYATFLGVGAGQALTSGLKDTFIGMNAGASNTTASWNTAVGSEALYSNATGTSNTAIGQRSLYSVTGSSNTALGASAGTSITSGTGNVLIGMQAGQNLSGSDSNNIIIGTNIGGTGGNNYKLNIGDLITGNLNSSGTMNMSVKGRDSSSGIVSTIENTYPTFSRSFMIFKSTTTGVGQEPGIGADGNAFVLNQNNLDTVRIDNSSLDKIYVNPATLSGISSGIRMDVNSTPSAATDDVSGIKVIHNVNSWASAANTAFGFYESTSNHAANTKNVIGIFNDVYNDGTIVVGGANQGSLTAARNKASNSGTTINVLGSNSDALITGGSVTGTAYGSRAIVDQSGGTVATAIGLYTDVSSVGGITNSYGLYIGSVMGSSAKYGIMQSDPNNPNQFSGKVAIGTSSGNAALYISGSQTTAAATAAPAGLTVTGIKGGSASSGQVGGLGSNVFLTAGAGGDAVSGGTNGDGGNIVLTSGSAGVGAGAVGKPGYISLSGPTVYPSSTASWASGNIQHSNDKTLIKVTSSSGTPINCITTGRIDGQLLIVMFTNTNASLNSNLTNNYASCSGAFSKINYAPLSSPYVPFNSTAVLQFIWDSTSSVWRLLSIN